MNRALRLLLGVGVSALCVWLSMKDVHLSEVLVALKGANPLGFVLVMLVTLGGLLAGFAQVEAELWPVARLAGFANLPLAHAAGSAR